MEEKEFKRLCEAKMDTAIKNVKNRNIYIWGAGRGGKILESVMAERGIKIKGFIDQRAESKPEYLGYSVKEITAMNPQYDYILVSLMVFLNEIVEMLEKMGYTHDDSFYFCENEQYNKEDIIYKGCRIGRYTYGYEGLLQYYPIAASIGRYCSINDTAKIWNNHPLEYVTTHPILDYPRFYRWDLHDERKRLCQIYGKYFENADFQNSPLRDNRSVVIGNDVWIGANVIILPGVHIGDGAVLAAGAVVKKDIEPYAIVGGIPAKHIKFRFSEDMIQKFLAIKWWDWEVEEIEKNIELFYQPATFLKTFYKAKEPDD